MWSLSFNRSVRWSKILNNCLLLKQPIIAQISRVKVYSSAFSNFVNETFILREAKIKFVSYTMEKDIYWIWNILILPFDVLIHFLCSCTSSFRYFVEICQRKITDIAKKYEKKKSSRTSLHWVLVLHRVSFDRIDCRPDYHDFHISR